MQGDLIPHATFRNAEDGSGTARQITVNPSYLTVIFWHL
jgi:hypothetical protein